MLPRTTFRWLAISAVCLSAVTPVARAQDGELREEFARLIAEGEREQIPWTVSLARPQLHLHQRLGADVKVTLSQTDLKRHGERHDLVLMVRLAQQGADWLPGFEWLALPVDEPLAKDTSIEFQVFFLVKPGDFRIGVVLLDRVSGHSNATIRPFRVLPLRDDPLPHAFRDLPPAEFLSATEGFEAAFLTKMKGQLWLPIETQRKVHIEILANFSLSEEFRPRRSNPGPFGFGRRRRRVPSVEDNLFITLSALKPLTEFAVRDGLRITALDLIRRRAVYEQARNAPPDWQQLSDALETFQPNVIRTDTLLEQKESAEFLRQALRQRMQDQPLPPNSTAAPPEEKPLRVLILLSHAMVFPEGADLKPIAPAPPCDCRVYFIRLRVFGNYWDQLDSILRPLNPHRFDVSTPAEYRRALAAILEDLRER